MEFEISHAIIIFFIGLGASFLSGIVGGGAGLVMVPALIFLGIDPKIAAATTTFGAIGLGIGSLSRFRKEKELRRTYIQPLTLISIAAGVVGPFILFAMDGTTLKIVIGAIILLIIPLFILKKNIGSEKRETTQGQKIIGYTLYTILLALQVAFGSGTGIAIIFILVTFFGLTMIETSATLRLPQLVSSLISIGIYAVKGGILNYPYGIALLIAMIIGSYLGSHTAIKSGNAIIKWIFAIFAVLLALMLLLQ